MRLYRRDNGDYINLDAIAYIEMYDVFAEMWVMGRPKSLRVIEAEYARLKQWLAATADTNNQPLAVNKTNIYYEKRIPVVADPTKVGTNGNT